MKLSNQSAVNDLCQWFQNIARQGEAIFEIISRLNHDTSSGEALSSLMSTMEDLFTEVRNKGERNNDANFITTELCKLDSMMNELACLRYRLASFSDDLDRAERSSIDNFVQVCKISDHLRETMCCVCDSISKMIDAKNAALIPLISNMSKSCNRTLCCPSECF
jgi:hypothetical protein